MATQITFDNLDTWLQNQPINTPDTPYELEITELTIYTLKSSSDSGSLGYILNQNSDKYVDLSSTTLPSLLSYLTETFKDCISLVVPPILSEGFEILRRTFSGCYSLINTPNFPDSVTFLDETFKDCTSLIEVSDFPSALENMYRAFYGCYTLEDVPFIPNSVTSMTDAFFGCSSLSYKLLFPTSLTGSVSTCYHNVFTTDWKGMESQIDNFVQNYSSSITADGKIDVYNDNDLEFEYTVYIVDVANLSSWLSNQSPYIRYNVYVRNLTTSNINLMGNALRANLTREVDLSYTTIPSGVTNIDGLFSRCINLRMSPKIPNGVTSIEGAFNNCEYLDETPELPNSVNNMESAFSGCTFLDKINNIPSSVTNMVYCFLTCQHIREIPEIPNNAINMEGAFANCSNIITVKNVPSNVTNMIDCFFGCSLLRKIESFDVPLATIRDNPSFHDMFYGCNNLQQIGFKCTEADQWHAFRLKITDNNGDSFVSGKVYSKDQSFIQVPTTQITKDTLSLGIKTDELWFPESQMLDSFIDGIIENVLISRYTFWNKDVLNPDNKSFMLWMQEPNNFMTNLPITQPIGTIVAYYGTIDPDGWFICDGRDTTNTSIQLSINYPKLYAILGNSNMLPDLRNRTLMGANPDILGKADGNTSNVGEVQKAQLPNIMGYIEAQGSNSSGGDSSNAGAFEQKSKGTIDSGTSSGSNYSKGRVFRADRNYAEHYASFDHLGDNVYVGDWDINDGTIKAPCGETRAANMRVNWIIKAV